MATSVATLSSPPPVTLPLSSSRSSLFSNCFIATTQRRPKTRSLVAIRPEQRRRKAALTCNALFGLGVPELAVIAGVAALLFGPKKLPEIGKSIGKTVKSFQQVSFCWFINFGLCLRFNMMNFMWKDCLDCS